MGRKRTKTVAMHKNPVWPRRCGKLAKAKAAQKQYNDMRESSAAAANKASSTEREDEMEQQSKMAEAAMAATNSAKSKKIGSKTIAATTKLLFKTGAGIDHMDEYLDEYKGVAKLGSGVFHPRFPNATAVVKPPAEPPMNITRKEPLPDW